MSKEVSMLIQKNENGEITALKKASRGRTPSGWERQKFEESELEKYSDLIQETENPEKTEKPVKETVKDSKPEEAEEEAEEDEVVVDADAESSSMVGLPNEKTKIIDATKKTTWSKINRGLRYSSKVTSDDLSVLLLTGVNVIGHIETDVDYLKFNQNLACIQVNLKTGDLSILIMDKKAEAPDIVIRGAVVSPKKLVKKVNGSQITEWNFAKKEQLKHKFEESGVISYIDEEGMAVEPYYIEQVEPSK